MSTPAFLQSIATAALAATLLSDFAVAAGAEGPAEAYYWFSHWMSMGKLDAAAAQFAADAVVVVEPACPRPAPCVGRAAIRGRYLTRIARMADERPLLDQRLDGETMYTHDVRSYRRMASGTANLPEGRYAFELRNGAIASLMFGAVAVPFESIANRSSR
jgi:hypothetical protein